MLLWLKKQIFANSITNFQPEFEHMGRSTKLLFIIFFCYITHSSGQSLSDKNDLKVYVDCSFCDQSVMRKNISYINYLRDPALADVHVLATRSPSGSNGYNYTFDFMGKGVFEGMSLQRTSSEAPNTASIRRHNAISAEIEKGLMPYWSQTGLIEQLDLKVKNKVSEEREEETTELEDPWNNWVFAIDGGGAFDFETVTEKTRLWGRLRINRISELWRVRNTVYARTDAKRFDNDEGTITSYVKRKSMSSSAVRSINDHWSAGAFLSLYQSTFSNLDLSTAFAPAFEYSIFPYTEVHQREVTVSYRVSHVFRDYIEETIYQKLKEHLYNQSIVMSARFKQPWGTLYAQLEGAHYWHDISQNRIEFEGYLSLRISKGLSIRLGSNFELINDQRSLPAQDISLEELLLAQRQSATSFRFGSEFGFSYTFGSIYNNIVNTRL